MHLNRLPQTVADRLHVRGPKAAAPYLKKVQQFFCRPMTYHHMCPGQCWRCSQRLLHMADEMPPDGTIGHWHNIVADATAMLIEETRERGRSDVGTVSTEHAARAFLETLRR